MNPNQVLTHIAAIVFSAICYALIKGLVAERKRKKRYAAALQRLAERDGEQTRDE